MTMQFKCDCCGHVEDVPQRGPECSASCIEPMTPPSGWRAIWTEIEVHDGKGGSIRHQSLVLYSSVMRASEELCG